MKNLLYIFLSVFAVNYSIAQTELNSSGSGGAYILSVPANVDALTPGLSFTFKANHPSVNPSTLSVNGLAAVTIVKGVAANLEASDILAGQVVTVVYDGTNFQMITPSANPGGAPQSILQDADGNTSINVEASPNQDVIHFNLGDNAGYPATEYFTMIGPRLEVINSGESVFIGAGAGVNDDLTANVNNFIGFEAGNATTIGTQNNALGYQALKNNTTGNLNVALGSEAMKFNDAGNQNIAIGQQALLNNNASNNVGVGRQTLMMNTTGNSNIAIGTNALQLNASGDNNIAIGRQALNLTTGGNNTSVGHGSGANTDVGVSNVFLGYNAGLGNTSGAYNTVIGPTAGGTNSSGSENVLIGYNAETEVDGLTNATAIGSEAAVGASNSMVLGSINGINGATASTRVGIGTTTPNNKLSIVTDLSDGFEMQTYGGANTNMMSYIHYGGTVGSPTATTNGTSIGTQLFSGYGTSTDVAAARIRVVASANYTDASSPGDILFETTNSASIAPTEKMRVTSDGNIGIGTSNPAATLDITGTDAVIIPVGTDAQRPASPEVGMIRYNNDVATYEGYNGVAWVDLAGGGAGGDFYADGSVAMTGQFQANGGTSAIPGISFASDQNTGIYTTAPDNLSFTTAGTQRMYIDEVGQVSIGGTSPVALFDVDGDVRVDYPSASQTAMTVYNALDGYPSSSAGTVGLKAGATSSGTEGVIGATLKASGTGSGAQTGVVVSADGNSTGTFNRGVVVTAENNANSNYGVDVFATGSSGTNVGIRINTGGTHASAKYGIRIQSAGSGTKYGIFTQGEDMNYIEGSVGIGNSFPSAKLHLNGDLLMEGMAASPAVPSASDGTIYFDAGTGKFRVSEAGGAWVDLVSTGGGDFFADGTVPMTGNFQSGGNYISNDGGSEGVAIATNGEVSATPATTGSGNIAFRSYGDIWTMGLGTGLYFTNWNIGITGNDGNAGGMHFRTSGSERLTINASGNVGIGTNSPAVKLHVQGNTDFSNDSYRVMRGGGSGDMIPVAYGVINDGVLQGAASEGDVSVSKLGNGQYRITYNGARTFSGPGECAVTLTTIDPSGDGSAPILASYDVIATRTVVIYLYDVVGGSPVDGIVSFELRVR